MRNLSLPRDSCPPGAWEGTGAVFLFPCFWTWRARFTGKTPPDLEWMHMRDYSNRSDLSAMVGDYSAKEIVSECLMVVTG